MKDLKNNDMRREIITSENSKELAEEMKKISAEILELNKELYKRLENT